MEQKKQMIYEHLKEQDAKDRNERLRRGQLYKNQKYYEEDPYADQSLTNTSLRQSHYSAHRRNNTHSPDNNHRSASRFFSRKLNSGSTRKQPNYDSSTSNQYVYDPRTGLFVKQHSKQPALIYNPRVGLVYYPSNEKNINDKNLNDKSLNTQSSQPLSK